MTDDAVPLGPGDLEACLELDGRALGQLWNREQWATELEEPSRPCLGIREQGQLLALASGWLVADELHITAIAVDPDCRRRGFGARVLHALLEEARRRGAIHATLEVAAANAAARALYAGAGFHTAGIRRAYYRDGDDALVQWLRLDDADPVRITGHS